MKGDLRTEAPQMTYRHRPQIQRFPAAYRTRIAWLIQRHPRLADTLYSFPMAVAMIAAGERSPADRGEAIWRIAHGRTLKHVAEALDVPPWTKRLPPEATQRFPPNALGYVETKDGAHAKIARHLPKADADVTTWSDRFFRCAEIGSLDFALWAANKQLPMRAFGPGTAWIVNAYMFFATLNDDCLAKTFIHRRWEPDFSAGRTCDLARDWCVNSLIELLALRRSVGRPLTQAYEIGPLTVTPLLSPASFYREAARMQNCLATYSRTFFRDRRLYFSLDHQRGEAATLELIPTRNGTDVAIGDLKGVRNKSVSKAMERSVFAALADPAQREMAFADVRGDIALNERLWDDFWRPYRKRFGDLPDIETFAAGLNGDNAPRRRFVV